jgi:hypothetical protein
VGNTPRSGKGRKVRKIQPQEKDLALIGQVLFFNHEFSEFLFHFINTIIGGGGGN